MAYIYSYELNFRSVLLEQCPFAGWNYTWQICHEIYILFGLRHLKMPERLYKTSNSKIAILQTVKL